MIKPYVYLIIYKPTRQKYVGHRYGNIRLKILAKDDFWKIYFTSSKIVKNLIKETGIDSFEIKWIKEFDTVKEVQTYEQNILVENNIASNDEWLNEMISFPCNTWNPKIREKRVKTNQEKFGYDYHVQSPEFKENSKQMYMERYGVNTNMKTEEFRIKSEQTCLKKYGFPKAQSSPIIKAKFKQTCLKKYGVKNILATEENKQKRKDLMMKKYGVTNSGLVKFKCDDCGFEGNAVAVNFHFQKTNHTKKLVLLADGKWEIWEKIKTNKSYVRLDKSKIRDIIMDKKV
jgi:hypothetical protein|tara:strand:+ start:55 stop:915 length:861 start_codon:yes stop_codon:yes gene_type:complete